MHATPSPAQAGKRQRAAERGSAGGSALGHLDAFTRHGWVSRALLGHAWVPTLGTVPGFAPI